MDANQSQMLLNMHDWLYDFMRGMVVADAGTPHLTKYVPNEILAELKARPVAGAAGAVDVNALADLLRPHMEEYMEAAAEKAVRKVLGAVDGASPP